MCLIKWLVHANLTLYLVTNDNRDNRFEIIRNDYFFFLTLLYFILKEDLLSSVTALLIPCPLMYMSKKHDTTVETGGLCALEQRK